MPTVLIDPEFGRKAAKLFKTNPAKKARVAKTLELLARDPRHPSLSTKKYDDALGIWQSYIEQHTPAAWRMWWQWDPGRPDTIIVVGFGPHP